MFLLKSGFYWKINSKRLSLKMGTPVLQLMLCILFWSCSCFNRNPSIEYAASNDSLLLDSVKHLNPQLRNDSIYADLILKIDRESAYIPIMGYVVDTIIPKYYMTDYCHVGDESFFKKPLHYLTKIAINDQTLVIAEFGVIRQRYYFLLNKEYQITDHIAFTSYRECIDKRKIYDWNRDGSKDIIEQRNYCGQLFSSTTEVVFSTINGVIERIFSLETEEINCVTLDEYGRGSVLRRAYKKKQPGLFRITEISGYIDGRADYYSDVIILSPTTRYYDMTTQELLDKFGTQYDFDDEDR